MQRSLVNQLQTNYSLGHSSAGLKGNEHSQIIMKWWVIELENQKQQTTCYLKYKYLLYSTIMISRTWCKYC